MTIYTCQIERDAAFVLSDTKATTLDHQREFATTKCNVLAHFPALVTGRGLSSILTWVTDKLSNDGYVDFDEVMANAGNLVESSYVHFFDDAAKRHGLYEKIKAEGYNINDVDFMGMLHESAQDTQLNIQVDVAILGYSRKKKRMTGVNVSSYDITNENGDVILEAFTGLPLEGHEVVLYGPENVPISQWVKEKGHVPRNIDELKSVLGFQYKWLVKNMEKYEIPQARIEDCGGDILLSTIKKNKETNQRYVGTLDDCVKLAESPGSNQQSMAKVGRNDPCPCGSGKKYKKCCGA